MEDIEARRLLVRQKHAELMSQQAQQEAPPVPSPSITLPQQNTEEDDGPIFVAFARVFSGTLHKGQELYVLGPKHDPSSVKDVNVEPNLTLKVVVANKFDRFDLHPLA